MASVTINEILRRAQEFELHLESYYAQLRDNTEDNGVRLLTYYLSRHRRHLDRAFDCVDPATRRRIKEVLLNVEVPFNPRLEIMKSPITEVHGPALLAAAVDHDSRLVNLYKAIADQPIGEEAGRFIESLVKLEEKDLVMLKKMIAMNYF
jgi:rubrerythrin